jgi:hypothetical protein
LDDSVAESTLRVEVSIPDAEPSDEVTIEASITVAAVRERRSQRENRQQ